VRGENIARLNKEMAVLLSPEVRQRLDKVGMEAAHTTPAAFGDYLKAEVARWAKVIREANIRVE
jgi:tripartite-type tricarboxylate transporter receptor subunit TctC